MHPGRFVFSDVSLGEDVKHHYNDVAFKVQTAAEMIDGGLSLNQLFNSVLAHAEQKDNDAQRMQDHNGDYRMGYEISGLRVFISEHFELAGCLQVVEVVDPHNTFKKMAQIQRLIDETGCYIRDLAIGVQHPFQATYARMTQEEVMERLNQGLR